MIELIGTYRVNIATETLSETVALRYPAEHFTKFERAAGGRALRAEIALAVLCEFRVVSTSGDLTADAFGQPLTGQVPYDTHYLSADGTELLPDPLPHAPPDGPFRIAFFLPAYRRWLPIRTPNGLAWSPRPAPMPDRLSSVIAYRFKAQ